MNQPRESGARVGTGSILKLLASLVRSRVSKGAEFDAGHVICQWARASMKQQGATDVDLPFGSRTLLGDRQHSERVLGSIPSHDLYGTGRTKAGGLSFLAPCSLTVSDGDAWRLLRTFNERVLETGALHAYAPVFLSHVRAGFHAPVRNQDDVSRAMGRAMAGIVFGESPVPGSDPGEDARVLFSVVANPIKKATMGRFYAPRRARFYADLRSRWNAADLDRNKCLLAIARRSAAELGVDTETALQQVPNWMFTFTGSGTKFLTRTLAMIVSRPAVHERALHELRAAGPLAEIESINKLSYLDGCFQEAGRLFPPVPATYHRATPATGERSSEVMHWFSLLQRDDALGETTQMFRPERWLAEVPDAPSQASNLFLRGPRLCAGRELILFVCRAAAARLLLEFEQTGGSEQLSRDPLPIWFPERAAVFR